MTWFTRLTLREKVLVLAVLPIAALLAAYQFAWVPLQTARTEYRAQIAAYHLVTDTARLATDSTVTVAPPPSVNQAPLANRITLSGDTAGIVLRRLEPDGTGIRVTLGDTSFVQVTQWLADMEQSFGIIATAIQIDRRPQPGIVSARILLEDL